MKTKLAHIMIKREHLKYIMELNKADKNLSPEEYFKDKIISVDSPVIEELVGVMPSIKSGGILVCNEVDTTSIRILLLNPKETKYKDINNFNDLYNCTCIARMVKEDVNIASNILIIGLKADTLVDAFENLKKFDEAYKDDELSTDENFIECYKHYKEYMLMKSIKERNKEVFKSLIEDYGVNPMPVGKNYIYLLECVKNKFFSGITLLNEITMLSLDNIAVLNEIFSLDDLDFIRDIRKYHKQYTGFDFSDQELSLDKKVKFMRTANYDRKY